jgi:hypothetical protein
MGLTDESRDSVLAYYRGETGLVARRAMGAA